MALRGINPNVLHPYSLQRERDPKTGALLPGAAVFWFRPLPASEEAKLSDFEMRAGTKDMDASGRPTMVAAAVNMGTKMYEHLRLTLRKWENVEIEDEAGRVVPAEFKVDSNKYPTEETLTIIPPNDRAELAEFVQNLNTITEADRKNS